MVKNIQYLKTGEFNKLVDYPELFFSLMFSLLHSLKVNNYSLVLIVIILSSFLYSKS